MRLDAVQAAAYDSQMNRSNRIRLTACAASALLVTACADPDPQQADEQDAVTVFAAASLQEPFTALADSFTLDHPEVRIELNFAGSSDLVAQIAEGAPADVVATADEATAARLDDEGLLLTVPQVFAENTLAVVTAPGNPAGISTLEDLADEDLAVVLCAPQVPCGAASRQVFDEAGVEVGPVSEERQVTDVLGKVTSGQADAGLVYVTDAVGAGDDVEVVDSAEISDAVEGIVNRYPIAVVEDTDQQAGAEAFVDHVTSEAGREVLTEAGFRLPGPS